VQRAWFAGEHRHRHGPPPADRAGAERVLVAVEAHQEGLGDERRQRVESIEPARILNPHQKRRRLVLHSRRRMPGNQRLRQAAAFSGI
jgi:hypothetical protein